MVADAGTTRIRSDPSSRPQSTTRTISRSASAAERPTRGATELTPAAARILSAASELFRDRGIRAVGVEAIAAAAGVTKKTIYDRFGSKDRLVATYLQARDERWRGWLTTFVTEHAGSPREQILTTFDALERWQRREEPRGCAFVSARAELTDSEHPGRRVVAEQHQWLLDYLTALARQANLRRPKALGRQLLVLHEGAAAAHGQGLIAEPAYEARAAADELLTAASRQPPR